MTEASEQAEAEMLPQLEIEYWPLAKIKPYDRNPRKNEAAVPKVAQSIKLYGFNVPILVDEDDIILAGHTRLKAAYSLGLTTAPVSVRAGLTEAQKRAYRIADNRVAEESEWDGAKLQQEMAAIEALGFDLSGLGFDSDELDRILKLELPEDGSGEGEAAGPAVAPQMGSLADRFGVPPFSVLNAREGWWQDRKRAWLGLGIRSELGRGDDLADLSGAPERMKAYQEKAARQASPGGNRMPAADYSSSQAKGNGSGKALKAVPRAAGHGGLSNMVAPPGGPDAGLTFGRRAFKLQTSDTGLNGTSIFDPVMAELAYRWFSPPGGFVLDPFAGGSVRGIVASHLGRRYYGVDLRAEQIAANLEQLAIADGENLPSWFAGDSRQIADVLPDGFMADFIFTCPPYADLEVYSDDPADLSAMDHSAFVDAYRQVIMQSCALLKPNRFACVVIGDARDDSANGNYYGLPWRTVEAFIDAGLELYNEAVLVTQVGSLPVRTRRAFEAARKLGKTHQNVLVFIKGDAKLATEAIGPCDFAAEDAAEDEAAAEAAEQAAE